MNDIQKYTRYMNEILLQSSLFFQNHIMNLPFFAWVFQQKRWAKHRQPTLWKISLDLRPRNRIPPAASWGLQRVEFPPKKTNPKNHWTLLEGFDSVFRRVLFDLQTTSLEIPWYSGKPWNGMQLKKWWGPSPFLEEKFAKNRDLLVSCIEQAGYQ